MEPRDAGATVHTADRTWQARVVIVAAGAWLEPLLGAHVRLPSLVVTQQDAFHVAPAGEPSSWPTFIYHDEIVRYGLPAGRDGEVPGTVKLGEHGRGTVTTADGRGGVVSPAARDRIRAFTSHRLPGLNPAPVSEVTCSGHGAKFAPLVGEIAADLAGGGHAPDPRFTLAAQRS